MYSIGTTCEKIEGPGFADSEMGHIFQGEAQLRFCDRYYREVSKVIAHQICWYVFVFHLATFSGSIEVPAMYSSVLHTVRYSFPQSLRQVHTFCYYIGPFVQSSLYNDYCKVLIDSQILRESLAVTISRWKLIIGLVLTEKKQ